MRHKKIFIGLAFLCFIVMGVIFHFRRDIVVAPIRCEVLEADTTFSDSGIKSVYHIMLVDNAPYLEHNIRQCLETYFWKNVCLDSLERYEQYKIYFYRKTKYLTLDFKEGNQYDPVYSHWDNTMDWRNHYEDRLGQISYYRRTDGSVCYIVLIYDSGWGIRMLVDTAKSEMYSEDCKNAKSLYRLKMKELKIVGK